MTRWFRRSGPTLLPIALACGALIVAGVLVWQAVEASGSPDPTDPRSREAAVLNTGILVFREGLEAILVLASITASLVGANGIHRRPVAAGSVLGFLATVATWFVAVGILSAIDAPALDLQAATGLLAIGVLLVVMNWFFHRIYWTGWISMQNRHRRNLMERSSSRRRIYWGLVTLGFASVYREGVEVVLFLQSIRLKVGSRTVLLGVVLGLVLTAIVGALTLVAHRRLPYKRMLVLTGVMLGAVLVVMVGESVQEMQQALWLRTTPVRISIPAWMGTWLSVFPNLETIVAQGVAAALVLGSYLGASYLRVWRPRHRKEAPAYRPVAPPVAVEPGDLGL